MTNYTDLIEQYSEITTRINDYAINRGENSFIQMFIDKYIEVLDILKKSKEVNDKSILLLSKLKRENEHHKTMIELLSTEGYVKNMQHINICSICFTNKINTIILPCGHVSCCDYCLDKLEDHKCPICRVEIRTFRKLFLP